MTPLPAALGGSELVAWRLDQATFRAIWDNGEGAYRAGGRWNSGGLRAVYCSLDPATAILEVAVHKGFKALDAVPHVLTAVTKTEPLGVQVVDPASAPNPNWLRPGIPSAGQQTFGDALLAWHKFVLIPSAVSTHSWNLIFVGATAAGAYATTTPSKRRRPSDDWFRMNAYFRWRILDAGNVSPNRKKSLDRYGARPLSWRRAFGPTRTTRQHEDRHPYPGRLFRAKARFLEDAIMNPFAMPISRRALFDALFRKHHQELLAFANRRLGSVTAQDIVQDAYAQLMQVSDLVAIENPRAYLYRVVGNLAAKGAAIDRLRTSWGDPEDALATLRSELPSADAAADAAIQLSKCVAALDELPKLQRHAFLLNRIDGLTHAEVAMTLGLSKRTVERYVAKALEHCLTRLGQDSR